MVIPGQVLKSSSRLTLTRGTEYPLRYDIKAESKCLLNVFRSSTM